jgi:hypothetical protein
MIKISDCIKDKFNIIGVFVALCSPAFIICLIGHSRIHLLNKRLFLYFFNFAIIFFFCKVSSAILYVNLLKIFVLSKYSSFWYLVNTDDGLRNYILFLVLSSGIVELNVSSSRWWGKILISENMYWEIKTGIFGGIRTAGLPNMAQEC